MTFVCADFIEQSFDGDVLTLQHLEKRTILIKQNSRDVRLGIIASTFLQETLKFRRSEGRLCGGAAVDTMHQVHIFTATRAEKKRNWLVGILGFPSMVCPI